MKKVALLILGLIVAQVAISNNVVPTQFAKHDVTLTGLQSGEGRYILRTEYVNDKFRLGQYSCVGANQTVYYNQYHSPKNHTPFHEDHLIKFSICQDETLANCQEFAVDRYAIFKGLHGYFQSDISSATVDISKLKNAFQGCEPEPELDEIVKQAIHKSDRRFAHVG